MVYKLLTFITGRLNPGISESTHGLNQSSNQASKTTRLYKNTRVTRQPVTRWVKLSLNFELLTFPYQLY